VLQVKMDRNLRKSLNTKQNNIDLKNNISISNMAEGQLSISQERGKPMSLVIKKIILFINLILVQMAIKL
tara:strand:- start:663 stop:872 length:210 start_codon:yes stop_codon:yes gene_type:complete